MQQRRWIVTCVTAAATLAMVGCDFEMGEWGSSDRFKEDFASTHPLKSGGRLYLESFNGSVEVLGWEKESVDISGTKYCASEEQLKQLKIETTAEPDAVRVRAIRPLERRGGCGARMVLRVPKRVILERVESSNGGLRVEGIEGNTRLKTSNGGVRVWSLKGDLEASTSNASVEVGQFDGSAVIRTSNGRIRAEGVRGFFEATTSNSSIDATLGDLDPSRPLRLHTSNGSINLTLENYKNNEIRAETSNGSINVRFPSALNARLQASTSHGTVSSDFEVKTTTVSKDRLEGSIGSGGGLIELDTSNGNIRIMKR